MNKWFIAFWITIVVAVCAFWSTVFYIAWHFLSKYW